MNASTVKDDPALHRWRRSLGAAPPVATYKLDYFIHLSFILFVLVICFEGPIRWLLSLSGLGSLIYIRDFVEVLTIVMVFYRSFLFHGWIEMRLFIPILLLITHAFASLLMGVSFISIVMAIKIFLPFFYGLAIYPIFEKNFDWNKRFFGVLFVLAVIGVGINAVNVKFPWEGVSYDTFFGSISTTKDWGAEGSRRLPGFTRASYTAAMVIAVTGLTVMMHLRSILLKLVAGFVGLVAIYLTTTKSLMIIFPVLILFSLISERRKSNIGKSIVLVLLILSILFPITSVLYDTSSWEFYNSVPFLLTSLWDRHANGWPAAFKLLDGPINYVFGSGVGSVGLPQIFGNNALNFNAVDNVALYSYLVFGVFGLVYISYPAIKLILSRGVSSGVIYMWSIGILMLTYGYGSMSNMLEEQFFCTMFGITCGYLFSVQRQANNINDRINNRLLSK